MLSENEDVSEDRNICYYMIETYYRNIIDKFMHFKIIYYYYYYYYYYY